MTDLECTNPFYQSSVKLCAAVKKHKCLHGQNSYHKSAPPECEAAWKLVSKECSKPIDYCRSRWKTLRRCFFQGVNRPGNRYYLHEHLAFLLKKKKKVKQSVDGTFSTHSSQKSFEDDLSFQENETETINLYDDEDDKSISSQTTSADELHDVVKQPDGMGVFIINEINENEDHELFGDDKRLNYKRSCKRPLDPEIINELAEDDPDDKRSRTVATEKHSFKSQLAHKPLKLKIDKSRINTTEFSVGTNKGRNADSFTSTDVKQTREFGTQCEMNSLDVDDIFIESIKTQLKEMNGRQKMNFKRKIYQSLLEVFDDNADFPNANEILRLPPKQPPRIINTTIGEMRLMRELVTLVQAAKTTPEIMNAKEKIKTSTPLQNNSPFNIAAPIVDNRPKPLASPISVSPSIDDEDLQYTIDHIDDEDDVSLPRTWEEIRTKPAETPPKAASGDNLLGLPRQVLQKMVSVAGSSGRTIVAHDGEKKRIYRIYPKLTNPNTGQVVSTKNDSGVGTFYVSSTKNSQDAKKDGGTNTVTISTSKNPQDVASRAVKFNNGISNTTVRTISYKPTNITTDTTNSANKTNQLSSSITTHNTTNGQTIFKSVHPANRILSTSTGLFKMVSTPKTAAQPYVAKASITPSTAITKPVSVTSTVASQPSSVTSTSSSPTSTRVISTKMPMLPPTADATSKRVPIVPARPDPQIMKRRYSICGPLAAENPNNPSPNSAVPISKSFVSTNNNNSETPTGISNIKISQAISLNTKATTSQTSVNTQAHSLNNCGKTPSTYTTTIKDGKIVVQSLQPSKDPIATKDPLSSATGAQNIPILQTAGTVEADVLDPLFLKQQHIKTEPADE